MPDDLADELGLAFSDPALEAAMWALVGGAPQAALDLFALTHADPDRRELHTEVLGQAGQRQLGELRRLADRDPADPDRWLLLGSALAHAAWSARGADVAENTTDAQIHGLITFTGQAREALAKVRKLAPADAVPWSVLLDCAQGVPEQDGEHEELFNRAVERHPLLYGAHATRLGTLTRKWYGSQREVLEFARTRTAPLPDGHPLHALTAHAHIEGYLDGAMRGNFIGRTWRLSRYFRNAEIRREVDAGSDRLLASDAYAGHPRFIVAHQAFAMVYHHAQDEGRSAPHLERSGTRPARWPWAYFGDHREEFANARRAAGLAT